MHWHATRINQEVSRRSFVSEFGNILEGWQTQWSGGPLCANVYLGFPLWFVWVCHFSIIIVIRYSLSPHVMGLGGLVLHGVVASFGDQRMEWRYRQFKLGLRMSFGSALELLENHSPPPSGNLLLLLLFTFLARTELLYLQRHPEISLSCF